MYRNDISDSSLVLPPANVKRPEAVLWPAVSPRLDPARGAMANDGLLGQVDFRLARNSVLKELRRGRLSRLDVCDAHPELIRTGRSMGSSPEPCPVCEATSLVQVSYAFGANLPKGGHPFIGATELARVTRRAGEVACYVVEVCLDCSWNHLVRTFTAGCQRRTTAT